MLFYTFYINTVIYIDPLLVQLFFVRSTNSYQGVEIPCHTSKVNSLHAFLKKIILLTWTNYKRDTLSCPDCRSINVKGINGILIG